MPESQPNQCSYDRYRCYRPLANSLTNKGLCREHSILTLASDQPSTSKPPGFPVQSALSQNADTDSGRQPFRCQYVSNLMLQCKNVVNKDLALSSAIRQQYLCDSSDLFCDEHRTHITAVRSHAQKLKSRLDPGLKSNVLNCCEPSTSSCSAAPHVYEPCCSESFLQSEENPLREARFLTDKEIARQYEASLNRTLERLKSMRELVIDKFKEHLKNKPKCDQENVNYKIVVRDRRERALLDNLRRDQKYMLYRSVLTPDLEKVYRKHRLEAAGIKAHPSRWLRDPNADVDDQRCEHRHFMTMPPQDVNYKSPVGDFSSVRDVVGAVLSALVDCVDARLGGLTEKRCSGTRIPMTDFCSQHVAHDASQKLFVKCTECNASCLPLCGSLCKTHLLSKKIASTVPMITPGAKLARVGVNGWKPVTLTNGSKALSLDALSVSSKQSDLTPSPASAVSDSRDEVDELKFPDCSLIRLTARKIVHTNGRRIYRDPGTLPEVMYSVQQKKMKLAEVLTIIDEDIPLSEFEKQMKNLEEKKTNGNSALVHVSTPVAVFQNVRAIDRRPFSRGRTNVPSTIQTAHTARGRLGEGDSQYLMHSSARTRPFVSSEQTRIMYQSANSPSGPALDFGRRVISRPVTKNVVVRTPLNRGNPTPRTLQFAHAVPPMMNGTYHLTPPAVSNIVRQNGPLAPLTTSGIRAKPPGIPYKNGNKNVPVHALTR